MFLLFVIGLIVVIMVAHYTVDVPQIRENKGKQEKREIEYIQTNGISVTAQYEYANGYYTSDINWKDGIAYKFIVDGRNKNIHILGKNDRRTSIPFSKIIGCDIFTDSEVTGGIGRAVVGGILAGDTGAIVGAVTAKKHIMSYKIVIYCEDITTPQITITLISKKTATKDKDYQNAVAFASNVSASIKAIIAQTNRYR